MRRDQWSVRLRRTWVCLSNCGTCDGRQAQGGQPDHDVRADAVIEAQVRWLERVVAGMVKLRVKDSGNADTKVRFELVKYFSVDF